MPMCPSGGLADDKSHVCQLHVRWRELVLLPVKPCHLVLLREEDKVLHDVHQHLSGGEVETRKG